MTHHDTGDAAAAQGRLPAIDMIRGLALCGMVAFHVDWDLAYGGWIGSGPADSLPWSLFGKVVAATFLALSGYSLVLARQRGHRAALIRIGRVAMAALMITAVTGWLFPQEAIVFGILHCIALTSLLALPLRRAPPALVLMLMVLCATAPALWPSTGLDGPYWWWLGLGRTPPRTLDYWPLLPWSGVVLLGMALALCPVPRPSWLMRGWSLKALAWLGRHSLSVYLLHQPLLFGMVSLAGLIQGPPSGDMGAFTRQCEARCVAAGAGGAGCASACRCMVAHLGEGGADLPGMAARCLAAPEAPSPSPAR